MPSLSNQTILTMKKMFFALMAVAAISFTTSSCKKCNTCTTSGVKLEYCSKDYTAAQLDALEAGCKAGGGTWD